MKRFEKWLMVVALWAISCAPAMADVEIKKIDEVVLTPLPSVVK